MSMTRKELMLFFEQYAEKAANLAHAKSESYADFETPFENFRAHGELGFLVRMSDKLARLNNLLAKKKANSIKDESVEDTIMDLFNYCWLLAAYRVDSKTDPKSYPRIIE